MHLFFEGRRKRKVLPNFLFWLESAKYFYSESFLTYQVSWYFPFLFPMKIPTLVLRHSSWLRMEPTNVCDNKLHFLPHGDRTEKKSTDCIFCILFNLHFLSYKFAFKTKRWHHLKSTTGNISDHHYSGGMRRRGGGGGAETYVYPPPPPPPSQLSTFHELL